jgi:hypothetical protein
MESDGAFARPEMRTRLLPVGGKYLEIRVGVFGAVAARLELESEWRNPLRRDQLGEGARVTLLEKGNQPRPREWDGFSAVRVLRLANRRDNRERTARSNRFAAGTSPCAGAWARSGRVSDINLLCASSSC